MATTTVFIDPRGRPKRKKKTKPGPKEGDTPARVLFCLCQEAAICTTSEELVRLVTGGCAGPVHALYRQYLLPFDDKKRRSLPIEIAWQWCRAVARVSTILRLSILLEPGRVRLGVFRLDSGKRFMIQMCDPAWVVGGEGLINLEPKPE